MAIAWKLTWMISYEEFNNRLEYLEFEGGFSNHGALSNEAQFGENIWSYLGKVLGVYGDQ